MVSKEGSLQLSENIWEPHQPHSHQPRIAWSKIPTTAARASPAASKREVSRNALASAERCNTNRQLVQIEHLEVFWRELGWFLLFQSDSNTLVLLLLFPKIPWPLLPVFIRCRTKQRPKQARCSSRISFNEVAPRIWAFPCLGFIALILPPLKHVQKLLVELFLGVVVTSVTSVTIVTITFTYFHNFSHTLCSFVCACLIDGATPWRPSSKADLLFKALEFGCNDSHQQVTMQPRLGMSLWRFGTGKFMLETGTGPPNVLAKWWRLCRRAANLRLFTAYETKTTKQPTGHVRPALRLTTARCSYSSGASNISPLESLVEVDAKNHLDNGKLSLKHTETRLLEASWSMPERKFAVRLASAPASFEAFQGVVHQANDPEQPDSSMTSEGQVVLNSSSHRSNTKNLPPPLQM